MAEEVRSGLLPHSAAAFLILLVLVLVTAPFVQDLPSGDLVDAIVVTLVLCGAVGTVGAGRRGVLAAITVGAPALVGRWCTLVWPELLPAWFPPAAFLVFVGFVALLLLRFILRTPRVTSEVLCASVSAYLLLGLLWATAFMLVERTIPGSFAGLGPGRSLMNFDALYLSLITLTTVGYGDLTPVSPPARMLAMTEALTGTMYVAVIVARLVSLYTVEASGAAERSEQP